MSDGPNTQVLVWRYGARKGISIPPDVDEQLRLAHELREHLVELVHERERAVAAVWAEHAQVAAAQQAAEEAQATLDALLESGAEERMRSRKRTTSVELRREIAEARSSRREARARARDAKKRAYARAAPALHEARGAERKARKAAYGEFVQRRGLYWGTFNDVVRQHDLADRRIGTARKQGRPARFSHHRYDGTGRIAVQLQRERDKPERTAELLSTSDSPWWGVLRLPAVAATDPQDWAGLSRAEQRRRGRAEIAVRVASREDRSAVLWEIPVQIHRPIPPGAEILAAEIVITRVADERRVSANLRCGPVRRYREPARRSLSISAGVRCRTGRCEWRTGEVLSHRCSSCECRSTWPECCSWTPRDAKARSGVRRRGDSSTTGSRSSDPVATRT